jgi:cell division protease FtsH
MGGATFALPEKDRMFYTKKYCMAQLQVCFAGRISEELFCNDITSGAQSDITQATSMAREMILTWGMGEEIGPINYGPNPAREMYFPSMAPEYSQKTAELIDKEVKAIIDEAYAKAVQLIETHKDKIDAITKALLKYETLDAEDVKIILDGGTLSKPTVSDLLAIEQQRNAQSKQPDEDEQSGARSREPTEG